MNNQKQQKDNGEDTTQVKSAAAITEESLAGAQEIYTELFETVQSCIVDEIDPGAIKSIISKVIDHFSESSYNELLLLTYSISKNNYIIAHIANNVILAVGFGVSLNLPKEDLLDLGYCAFGHDFGMIEYTNLFQKGNQLTEDENALIQKHPLKSAEMFDGVFSDRVIAGILDVHESVDGQGYPNAKSSFEISYLAKIVAVCDSFAALTHPRNFRSEFSPYEAIKLIIKKKNVIFDSRVVKKFVEFMSIYPIGSLVYINSGETGMVVASNPAYPSRSIIQILLTAKREVDESKRVVDLVEDTMLYVSGVVERREEREILNVLKPRGDLSF